MILRIVNWNTQGDKDSNRKRNTIRAILRQLKPDIICLTEAYPDYMPDDDHIITSNESGWKHEEDGARKVILWSRWGWSHIDVTGHQQLPPGRYLRGVTTLPDSFSLTVIGVCIPYDAYRQSELGNWRGHQQYTTHFHSFITQDESLSENMMIAGDYNVHPYGRTDSQYKGSSILKLRQTLEAKSLHVITRHLKDTEAQKTLVCHMATDLHQVVQVEEKGHFNGLSDHPLTYADIQTNQN